MKPIESFDENDISEFEENWVKTNIQTITDVLHILNEQNIDVDANRLAHFLYLNSVKSA